MNERLNRAVEEQRAKISAAVDHVIDAFLKDHGRFPLGVVIEQWVDPDMSTLHADVWVCESERIQPMHVGESFHSVIFMPLDGWNHPIGDC